VTESDQVYSLLAAGSSCSLCLPLSPGNHRDALTGSVQSAAVYHRKANSHFRKPVGMRDSILNSIGLNSETVCEFCSRISECGSSTRGETFAGTREPTLRYLA
jgi:hypothetical protein